MKKKRTTFIFISSLLAAIAAICLFAFFLKVIENKNKHTSVVLSTLEGKMQEKENAVLFADKVAETKSLQRSIDNYFLDPNQIDTFVGYLERIGSNLGGEVVVNNIEIPLKVKNMVNVKLSVFGTFEEVVKIINYIENAPYQIDVTQLYLNKEIDPSTGDEKAGEKLEKNLNWQADLSFKILSLN